MPLQGVASLKYVGVQCSAGSLPPARHKAGEAGTGSAYSAGRGQAPAGDPAVARQESRRARASALAMAAALGEQRATTHCSSSLHDNSW